MPRPPRHTGRAMRSCLASLKADWPVRVGKRQCHTASYKGMKRPLYQQWPCSGTYVGSIVYETVGKCCISCMYAVTVGDGD